MTISGVPYVTLPPGAAVAAVHGHVGRSKAGTGVAIILGANLHLHGIPSPERHPDRWIAAACSVEAALSLAAESGARHLRVLLENCEIRRVVAGVASPSLRERAPSLCAAVDGFRNDGGYLEAIVVQAGTETLDLPSRLNDLSRILAGQASQCGATYEACAMAEGWDARLVASRPEFRHTRLVDRQWAFASRGAAADFLGIECGMVDVLLRAGHLDLTHDGTGVTRRSLTRVYEAGQRLRDVEFFGGWRCEGGARQAAE